MYWAIPAVVVAGCCRSDCRNWCKGSGCWTTNHYGLLDSVSGLLCSQANARTHGRLHHQAARDHRNQARIIRLWPKVSTRVMDLIHHPARSLHRKSRRQAHAALKDIERVLPFFVAGISLILYPCHPRVPMVHANYRYFEVLDVPLPYSCPRELTTPMSTPTAPTGNSNDNGTDTDTDNPIPEPNARVPFHLQIKQMLFDLLNNAIDPNCRLAGIWDFVSSKQASQAGINLTCSGLLLTRPRAADAPCSMVITAQFTWVVRGYFRMLPTTKRTVTCRRMQIPSLYSSPRTSLSCRRNFGTPNYRIIWPSLPVVSQAFGVGTAWRLYSCVCH